ncbi:MAG TPA: hypothetical protein PLN53_02550, partial [Terricaulis sp.]|nr:hypothetical protein [Terricaulis sp.]
MAKARFWQLMAAASVAALLAACATPAPTPEELEAQAWASASAGNSPAAYEAYLTQYADGPNAFEARQRVQTLINEEREAWARTTRTDTEAAYEDYLRAYP